MRLSSTESSVYGRSNPGLIQNVFALQGPLPSQAAPLFLRMSAPQSALPPPRKAFGPRGGEGERDLFPLPHTNCYVGGVHSAAQPLICLTPRCCDDCSWPPSDDPYYIASIVASIAFTVALVVIWIVCKVMGCGNMGSGLQSHSAVFAIAQQAPLCQLCCPFNCV
eukprot:SAG31_NODE_314_length_17854_cov_3.932075_10_plen_165_part_00